MILDEAFPGFAVSEQVILYFRPPAGIILKSETTADFRFLGLAPGTILLTPLSIKIERQRKRPWQRHTVSRRGLPCVPAFACTDYKIQGQTLKRVGLELRGNRSTVVQGISIASQCDPYSLYVQLSQCQRLRNIRLLSEVRERDIVGNCIPEAMARAEERLIRLSDKTILAAQN